MSDYPEFTPTAEQVRAAYAHDPEAEYRDPVGFPAMQRENLRAFDRWLAAHDAEVLHRAALFLRGSENPRQADNTMQSVRHSMDDAGYELLQLSKRAALAAGVVAEEPEWEYEVTYTSMSPQTIDGHRLRRSSGRLPSFAAAMEWVGFSVNPIVHRRRKAVPAGEWEQVPLPVEQEGAETDA